jgi:hypothetical protein
MGERCGTVNRAQTTTKVSDESFRTQFDCASRVFLADAITQEGHSQLFVFV